MFKSKLLKCPKCNNITMTKDFNCSTCGFAGYNNYEHEVWGCPEYHCGLDPNDYNPEIDDLKVKAVLITYIFFGIIIIGLLYLIYWVINNF